MTDLQTRRSPHEVGSENSMVRLGGRKDSSLLPGGRPANQTSDPTDMLLGRLDRVRMNRLTEAHQYLDQVGLATGALVLADVYRFVGRFVAYPTEHAHVAHVLWVAHAHLMDRWDSTPRIAFLSPEPASGKSRALEVTSPLVPRAVMAVNTTPAYLFRKVADEAGRPTILYDEIDTVFGPKAKDHEEIRGLLNAGHRKGAVAGRCVVRGNQVFTEEIPAYCAVALAGLGGLPDTILSRSVIIRMRRRAKTEHVEPYRPRLNEPEGLRIGDRLAAWCASIVADVTDVTDLSPTDTDPSIHASIQWPVIPDAVQDRDADIWEALLAIADAAGGDWPERARVAAVALVTESKQTTPSLGVRLLADLYSVFADNNVLSTETILNALVAIEESPWGDLHGKPLDSRGLSHRLGQYQIKPTTVRIGDGTRKGYKRTDLYDSWNRYLPSVATESVTRVTSATVTAHLTDVADVTDLSPTDTEEVTGIQTAPGSVQ